MASSKWFLRCFRALMVLAIGLSLLPPAEGLATDNPIPDVLAWGYNAEGQASVPADFSNDSALAAGWFHNLALKADGTVWSWGMNVYGQLGSGSADYLAHPTPAQVPGLSGVASLGAGAYHSLAVRSDGTVWAWGSNGQGQLGDGSTNNSFTPIRLAGLGLNGVGWARMAAGGWGHSLAALADGSVWAWGLNNMGQLGLVVDGPARPAAASGGSFVLDPPPALSSKSDMQLGSLPLPALEIRPLDFTIPYYSPTPVPVPGISGIIAVAAGYDHSMALQSNGVVWTWGDNAVGQLGLGIADADPHPTPAQVPGLTNVVAIAAGVAHSLALKDDGTVWAWGRNVEGELGDGSTTNASSPVLVSAAAGSVRRIAAGGYHSLAVLSDNRLAAWGFNASGQTDLPAGVTNATRVAGGFQHSLALLANRPPWDVNGDHVANVLDVILISSHFGESGPTGWIPEDVNADGIINVQDVVLVGAHFGETW